VKANPDARIERLLANDEAAIVLAGDGPDGLAVRRFRSAIFTERLDAYLEEFYVAPDRRGRGLGRRCSKPRWTSLVRKERDGSSSEPTKTIRLPERFTKPPGSATVMAAPAARSCSSMNGSSEAGDAGT